ncbi:hypothetical protein [Caballeronia sp. dw_19]|uniref:hypothetical protein n=1 Tax=Caballeronia sp. dw_19 TaxID=2719791 RepID=UPI001BCE35F2|nr:hypothetical protein [Caballeronia sp. dw_19]
MNRASCDNALLHSCDRVHAKLTKAGAYGLFVCVGVVWFLCVAIPAGAIWK